MTGVRTTCPYCGVGCGVIAKKQDNGTIKIEGDADHPANFGKLCSKGLALGETLGLVQRQLHPVVDGLETSWDRAIKTVAERFNKTIAEHGKESVAFYVSGQLLTEDYYVANKLMKGFIGTANIDTNSRLCMASAVAGHKRAFGADIVPCGYSDLEAADLIVLVGSNLAWCHPVLFQRIQAEREKRSLKLVVIDPRRTPTAESADLHLQIKSDTDVALFGGLLNDLYGRGEIDTRFVFARTSGLGEALQASRKWTKDETSRVTGIPVDVLTAFFDLFAATPKTVTMFSMGVNQSEHGTNKVNAIINCHLLTGRIGKEGAGPFSITGQPNAMGGREVGGLATMLAAHMEFDNPLHRQAVQDHWNSPSLAEKSGLKAVDMFKAIADGRIKALWIMSTNPAVSMPDASAIDAALKACPFVVLSDITRNTDTAQHAHVFLPAAGWGEKDGTVTNSERCISRQRSFLPKPGETRADWQIVSDVAKAMGFHGFDYTSPSEVFAEHVALTEKLNNGKRKLDLSAWSNQDYETMPPQQWGGKSPFKDLRFQTSDSKARFIPTPFEVQAKSGYTLNTGRIRDQWHTMTRTGLVPKLFGHRAEPYIEIHPQDAFAHDIGTADIVEVCNGGSTSLLRALITDTVRPGDVFQSMHWSSPFAQDALANANTAHLFDPISGQPALKSASVSIKKFNAVWYGFAIANKKPVQSSEYMATRPLANGVAIEMASAHTPDSWSNWIMDCFGESEELAIMHGSSSTEFRCAVVRDGVLVFAFFASSKPVQASREWLQSKLGTPVSVLEILAARPARGLPEKGPIICACNNVGRLEILNFVAAHPGTSERVVSEVTHAGTGCGSCKPEIRRLLKESISPAIAAE